MQHFDTHINSSHEGTNKGIKYGAAPCLPNYSIERAAKVLAENGEMKSQMCAQKAGSSHLKTKLWSKLPTSEHVVDLAEALVTAQWKEKQNYECIRTSERMFLLVRLGIDLPQPVTCPIPQFRRVRKVEWIDRVLICDCGYFQRVGIPCRHLMKVMTIIIPEFQGVSHHHVSVVWWTAFSKYAYCRQQNQSKNMVNNMMARLCERLHQHDIRGPSVEFVALSCVPIVEVIPDQYAAKPIELSVLNKTEAQWVALFRQRQGGRTSSTQYEKPPTNMTQESVVYDDCDDNDDDNCTTGAGGFFNDTLVSFRSNPSLPSQPFMELNPTFKELCALYKDNSTSVEIDSIQAFMSDMITKKRTEIATHHSRLAGQPQVGTLISSHVVSNKRRKTHGTKHMK